MTIYIASDHGGYELKKHLSEYLRKRDHEVVDMGNSEYDPNDDYPDFVLPLSVRVSSEGGLGIVIGRSGNGEVIAANKVQGIRAALCTSKRHARKAREDNHANVLALGADFTGEEEARVIVDEFINTDFSIDERHVRRVGKITSYETSND